MGKVLLLSLRHSLLEEPWQVEQEHLIVQSELKEGHTGLPDHAERRLPLHVNANNLPRLQHRQKPSSPGAGQCWRQHGQALAAAPALPLQQLHFFASV